MTIIDAHTRLIINDQIRKEEFTKETIKKYFKESFKGLKLNTIITDGYSAYPEIIEEIGWDNLDFDILAITEEFINYKEKNIQRINFIYKTVYNKEIDKLDFEGLEGAFLNFKWIDIKDLDNGAYDNYDFELGDMCFMIKSFHKSFHKFETSGINLSKKTKSRNWSRCIIHID